MSLKNKYLYTTLALVLLAGCKAQVPLLPGITPYKIDIQQGNAVTQEMVAKLQPGMTRNQVRFVLGTPLLVDPFRADRWDYFYSYMKGGTVVEERKLVVFFKDDKLVRVEGDVIPAKPPAEKPVPLAADKPKPEVVAPKPDAAAAKPEVKPVAKPEAAKPEVAKPQPVTPPAAPAPAATILTTGDGVPVGSNVSAAPEKPALPPATKPDVKADTKVEVKTDAKSAATKPDTKAEEKPKEERGFFGRMLDRIGL